MFQTSRSYNIHIIQTTFSMEYLFIVIVTSFHFKVHFYFKFLLFQTNIYISLNALFVLSRI